MAMRKVIVSLLPVLLLAGGLHAWAQATTGSVSGRVADPQGSVVPGAHVSVTDVDTGIVSTAMTDHSGEFDLTALPPGHYTVSVEMKDFSTATVPAFELNIDQKARFNISMKVGAVTAEVVVNDSAPILQVQGAETGQVIGAREIEDLPLDGRNFASLMLLVPGVGSGGGGNNLNLSVNGQREFSNSVEINGVEVTGNRNNDTNMVPSPDAVQEFKVVTSSYAPEFGRASGGSILIQTKSGSNAIHGSALFFYRPTATAANPALTPAGTPPALQQKIYGASIGGPIKKDKAFLFLNFEGNRQQNVFSYAGNTPPVNQVKFDGAGDADLSGLTDPFTGNEVPIFNPYFFENNYYTYQFPGNIIPANMVSPAGKLILQNLYPVPQNNSFFTNFAVHQAYTDNNNVANLRADYNLSQKDRVYLTYDAEQGDTSAADPYAGAIPIANGGSGDSGDRTSFENNSISLRSDHTFSPTLLNDAGVSFFLSTVSQNSPLAGTDLATKWNIQNVVVPGFPATNNIPQIGFESGPTVGGSTYKPLTFRDQNLTFVDGLTWTRSKHNVKLGYEYRHLNSHPNFPLFPTPYEYFGGAYSALTSDSTYCEYSYTPCNDAYGFYDPSAYYGTGGSEIADLLLGLPYVVDQGLQLVYPSTTANEHSFYGQDYWQITPKLNITYGVRYEYQQPYVEAGNSQANFNISTMLIDLAGRGANSRSVVDSNTTDFMPRAGFSYQLRPTWVIRGGFGIFYSPENDAREDILTKNYPFFPQQQYVNSVYYLGYVLDTGAPRPTSIPIPSGTSTIDLTTVSGGSAQTVHSEPNNFPTAHSTNYNLTVEKQLGRATSAEVGYVGANTRNLSYAVGNYNVNGHLSSKLGQVNALLPSGISNFDSLQAKINRSFSAGYSVLGSYTYARGRDNGPAPFNLGKNNSYPQNPFDLGAEYANSDTDLRHHFSASQIIELPVGHGKRFLSHANGLTQGILGGWQLNSITTLQTGKPFNVVSDGNNQEYPGLRPNLIGNPKLSHPGIADWFNTKAFSIPTGQSQSTGAGKTLITGDSPRNPLYGPGYTNEDLSLFKVLTLPREMKFQIRIESFNLLNTAHYDNPVSDLNAGTKLGTIQGGYYPRVMQFAGRLIF
jgi:Carboxypeptidase regulatory-like domain/TonB dependent receptor/TonB-dependent Receptor Plug Domain